MDDDFRISDDSRAAGTGGGIVSSNGDDTSADSTTTAPVGKGGNSSEGGEGTVAVGARASTNGGDESTGGTPTSVAATTATTTGTKALRSCDDPVTLSRTATTAYPYGYGTASIVADLNAWDEVSPLSTWAFAFQSDTAVVASLRVSSFDDQTGSYEYGLVADGSGGWAARAYNTRASDWGGGVAILIDCVNAAAYTGVSFRARGNSPMGRGDLLLRMPNVGTVQQSFQLTTSWRSIQLPFMGFVASSDSPGARTTGDGIDRLAFAAELIWMESVATPGGFEIFVDDVGFY